MNDQINKKYATPIIFHGANYIKTCDAARNFIEKIIGKKENDPDLLEFHLEGKNYTKEQITDFLRDVSLAPYESDHKVYLFHNADKMLPVHANALLKTFEEKPDHAVILLLTDNVKAVIETIQSRSKKEYIASESDEKKGDTSEEVIKVLGFIKNLEIYKALDKVAELENNDISEITSIIMNYFREEEMNRLGVFLDGVNNIKKELLKEPNKITLEKVSEIVEKAQQAFERYMKPKVILEYTFLSLYKELKA
jgi:DNA polymerase-3 subunit delta'